MRRRVLAWTAGVPIALLIIAIAALLFLLTTASGARLVVGYVERRLPFDLAVGQLDGRLMGPLELRNARLTVSGVMFEIAQMQVEWRPLQLIDGRLHLESVRIDGLRIAIGQSRPETEPQPDSLASTPTTPSEPGGISLPIEIVLGDVRLRDGSLLIPEVAEFQDVSLEAHGSVEAYTAEISAVAKLLDSPAAPINVSGSGDLGSFTLESFHARALQGELRARGSVSWTPQVEWRIDVEADTLLPAELSAIPEDWPGRLSLSVHTDGRLDRGRPSLVLDVDTLHGSLRGQPIAGRLSGGIEGSEYELARADLDWGPTRIDAAGEFSRERLALDFELESSDVGASLPRSSGSVSAAGKLAGSPTSPQIQASLLARDLAFREFSLDSARAVIDGDWAAQHWNDAQLRIFGLRVADRVVDSLDVELKGTREKHILTGNIASTLADITLSAGGALQDGRWAGELRDLRIATAELGVWGTADTVRLSATRNIVELDTLCLAAEEGGLCLGGAWASDEGWHASMSIEDVPLPLLDPLLPDEWSLTGQISGDLDAAGRAANVNSADVDLRAGPAALTYTSGENVNELRLIESSFIVRATADSLSSELALTLSDAEGTPSGAIVGDAVFPPLDILTRIAVSKGLAAAANEDWRLSLSIEDLALPLLDPLLPGEWSFAGRVSSDLFAAGRGAILEFADVDLRTGPAVLSYASGEEVSVLRLIEGTLSLHSEPDSLASKLALTLADTTEAPAGTIVADAFLPPVDLLTREISSEGIADALSDDWRLSLSIDDVELSHLDPLLPTDMTMMGALEGSLAATAGTDGALTARLELKPRDATLVRSVGTGQRSLRFLEPLLRMQVDTSGLHGELSLEAARPDSAPHATLSGTIDLPEYHNLNQPIASQPLEGELAARIDLSLIDAIVEAISATVGHFEVDLAASGTLSETRVSGHYRVQGQSEVPPLGIQLSDIELTGESTPDGNLEIRGHLLSGEGRLEIVGDAPLIPSPENPGHLTIQGDRFRAMQGDQIRILVSPDLTVTWTGATVDISGDVTVPRATVEIIEIPETAVPVSNDVVLAGVEEEPRRPINVSADVRLILGDEILFKGFGFTTNLDGTIQLIERPGVPTQGRGELVLREGVYRGYGQNLTIDPGRLTFAGPIDDPGVDVRAYRRATDGTRAGFLIGGTLKSLEIETWSDPAMSESAVLSYVLFGRSLEQGSEADRSQAGGAAAIIGGNMLAMSMASQVGLDEARIEGGARQKDAAFYAGKYLSPRFYVAYGVGLFEPIEVLRVRYLISRKLTLQAETGSRDSGDILYTIEH